MPDTLAVFLDAFSPRRICRPCLAKLLGEVETDVRRKLAELHRQGRIEVSRAACLNCSETRMTVRRANSDPRTAIRRTSPCSRKRA